MLDVAKGNKSISLVEVSRGGPNVTHLFFADDSLIFGRTRTQDFGN